MCHLYTICMLAYWHFLLKIMLCITLLQCVAFSFQVIQRRVDGSVDFNRSWQEYKNGFGFLFTEFWLGNEKLSYLTNQANYELWIDIESFNGTSLFVSHDAFRISVEWSQYRLADIGDFHGDIGKYFGASPLKWKIMTVKAKFESKMFKG